MGKDTNTSITLHASCVDLDGRGLLVTGPSGSGKSTLCLALLALGARLVSDDRTLVARRADQIRAAAPDPIRGLIEARGLGLLHLPTIPDSAISLVVDMAQVEDKRLPETRSYDLFGLTLPLLRRVDGAHFAPSLLLCLKYGWPALHD